MSLKSSIFTDSQAKVYLWLFGQVNRVYYLSELRRLTGLSSASLQREINKLTDAKLIHSAFVGNQRQIQANPQSPIFNEIVAITRKVLGVVPLLQEALTPLESKLDIAILYGSIAKETDHANSDIDVMLVGSNLTLSEILEHLELAENQLNRKVNPTCYTVTEFRKRLATKDSFVNQVLSQPNIELIGSMNAFCPAD